jgi:hypothetical protein
VLFLPPLPAGPGSVQELTVYDVLVVMLFVILLSLQGLMLALSCLLFAVEPLPFGLSPAPCALSLNPLLEPCVAAGPDASAELPVV